VITDLALKLSMGTLLAITAPLDGDGAVWAQWGLAGVVVAYVLWRDWHREKRMSEAIERDHTWVRETLLGALERNTAALQKMVRSSCREHGHAGGDDQNR
jgi:hypothetical protein